MMFKRKRVDEPMEIDEEAGPSGVNDHNDEIDHISDDEEGGVRIGDIYIPPAPKPALSFDATGPRLIITHIVNENFKSYAGVETLGPFHKSFTSIIGPNGSGKSNVIDSMLFVFGYRATKIRSKKISVLIHSSKKFPNLTSASVAVHFVQIIDGEGETFTEVPNSNIVVSRTAFKDNSSHYTLNGRRVQFKEVGRMLQSHGIDLDHNRFLILQGEVEQIAMMKPKAQNVHESGMLEYLEDIIGTSRYKEPIEKLFIRVEEYSELRKEKLNRVRLVEQEKQKLEGPMREAVELMNLTNVALRTRNLLLQKYIRETNKIIEGKNTELQELKETLRNIDEKLDSIKNELQEKVQILEEGTKKYDEMKKKKADIEENLKSAKKELGSVVSVTTQANKKKKNLEQMLEQDRGKLIDLELIPDKNKREIEDCEKLLVKHKESQEKANQELQTVMRGVNEKTAGLREQKDALGEQFMDLQNIVETASKSYHDADTNLKLYVSIEQNEINKYENLKETYENLKKDMEEKKTLVTNLSSSLPNKENQLKEIQVKLQAAKKEESGVTREVQKLRSQLEISRQAMRANRSRGRVLDSLMKEKNAGRLPGIFGRLGDLGGIDAKYDVAISTCCGALDNIVVDTVETAQAAVEYLKHHDIGRATFIALDRQTHLQAQYQNRQTYPERAPRLFDLVTVRDERVLPAFYYALRETLVATDLEQASRIAYGSTRYRVVSLKGDVIEIAGTMSGGGKSVMRGRMSNTVQQDTTEHDPTVIQANEQKLERLEKRLSELYNEMSSLENDMATLENTVREEQSNLRRFKLDLDSLTAKIPDCKRQIKQQESKVASCKVDPKQKAKLEEILRNAEEKLEEAKNNAGQVKQKMNEIDDKIGALTGNKVKDLQKSVEEYAKKIKKISAEITKLNVAITVSVRETTKLKAKIDDMAADLTQTERNLETYGEQKKKLTLDTKEFQRQIEELDEQINEGTSEFSGIRQEIGKLQAKENKIQSQRIEANNAVSSMEKVISDCTVKIPSWQKELRSLKLEDPGLDNIPGIERPAPFAEHSNEELDEVEVEELRRRLVAQKGRIGDQKPNVNAIQEYKAKEDLYLRRAAELEEITNKRNEMRTLYDQLKKKRNTDFLSGFNTITSKLKEMYQMITLGGDAELELVDSLDPFTEGITFSVRPPNKSWKNISNLSGGEKTLSSLALVFALHYYKPTPLYVMDEIDAALDFKNVSIVANYIKERTKNAQFIIISLRYNMFEVANRLVGIYKTEDCTKSVVVDNQMPSDNPDENTAERDQN